ncbi:ribonuclease H-like [Stegodyphus dumicola]|uniref:ribonuclease H-like n=1 Tax=Stegodyphus dumicola TaxID=202533 RepID=UPI0015AE526E|nr:ribonuclease H-like [Stegodyphus dumicola]
MAIFYSLKWIKKTLKGKYDVHIYSDSLTVLQALSRPDQDNPLTVYIRELYKDLREDQNIVFNWVKAHVGHFGKERADALAKEAMTDVNARDVDVQGSKRQAVTIMKNYYL